MIIPSIDLMDGKAVQLISGEKKVIEIDDPMNLAERFTLYGEIAVIDLDAAKGDGENSEIIKKLIEKYPCRVGGGIRTVEKAVELISFGASKVIIGTSAFVKNGVNFDFLKLLVEKIGKKRIIVAVDTKKNKIVTKGWKFETGLDIIETSESLIPYVSEILFTSVENEGKMSGYNSDMVKKLRESIKLPITIAGGISTTKEIAELTKLDLDVQLGMAIYTGKLNLSDAFISGLNWKDTLMPVITQDIRGQVLMLAYMNRKSLRETIIKRKMCYYSRSRKKLWTKGETSGNFQKLIRLISDCDRDTLIAIVEQTGDACHLEKYSCFGDKNFSIELLQDIVKNRLQDPASNSYTASLDYKQVRTKINEEAYELISAESRDEIIWEAADLFYFTTVLMTNAGIEFKEILNELKRRNRKGGKNEDY